MQIFGQRGGRARLNRRITREELARALRRTNQAGVRAARLLEVERVKERTRQEAEEAWRALPWHKKVADRAKRLIRRVTHRTT